MFGDDNKVILEYFGNRVKEDEILKALQEKHTDVLEAVKAQLA
jgi:NACalpha-BTF3-like transcription factor